MLGTCHIVSHMHSTKPIPFFSASRTAGHAEDNAGQAENGDENEGHLEVVVRIPLGIRYIPSGKTHRRIVVLWGGLWDFMGFTLRLSNMVGWTMVH